MKRKLTAFLLFVVAGCLLAWLFEHWLSLDHLIANELWLRQQVKEHPLRTYLIGFAIYVAASLIPGTAGKSIVYGWIFGLAAGLLIVTLALTIAATFSFCFSRYVLCEAIHRRLGHYVTHIDRALERDGASYLFAMRLIHVPYTLTNYAMGATTIPVHSFIWATLFGLLPGSLVMVYAGSQLPTLETLAEQGILGVVSPQLFIAGTLLAISPIAIRYLLRRFRWWRTPTQVP
ncbi:MAG: TVP38/TMEM64 family protein [Planctomycetaceae bacterium]|nr:TVP38/TMEM64 family protein [Planctomycetales bacterium]MCB9922951.1 TVP38/TMEM64 family protein [Planctomycetaceae bacterium]